MGYAKRAAALVVFVFLAGCNTFSYFHDRNKPAETIRADYLECGRIAYVEKRNVHVPLKSVHAATASTGSTVPATVPAGSGAAVGAATGFAAGFAEGWSEGERKKQNLIKCMALRGYTMYRAGGSTNSEFRSLPQEKKIDRRVELGLAERPVGELVPYPPEWDLTVP